MNQVKTFFLIACSSYLVQACADKKGVTATTKEATIASPADASELAKDPSLVPVTTANTSEPYSFEKVECLGEVPFPFGYVVSKTILSKKAEKVADVTARMVWHLEPFMAEGPGVYDRDEPDRQNRDPNVDLTYALNGQVHTYQLVGRTIGSRPYYDNDFGDSTTQMTLMTQDHMTGILRVTSSRTTRNQHQASRSLIPIETACTFFKTKK